MSPDWLTYCPGSPEPSLAYVTPSFLEGTDRYTPYLMGTPGRPASSAHLAINMARVHLAVRPSILGVSSRDHPVTCLNLRCTLAALAGTRRRRCHPTYVTSSQRERGTGIGCRVFFNCALFHHQCGRLGCAALQPSRRTVLGNNRSGLASPRA
jgi:hypothetical protein